MVQIKIALDEKGRITIPQEIRQKLGLFPGSELNLSVVKNTLLIKKTLTPAEFEKLSDSISEALKQEIDTPIKFEKLF